MFRNLLNPGPGKKGFFGGKDESSGDKASLPEQLQMSIDIAQSMQSIVSMLVTEGEPVTKVQEEMEPLHRELVNLLQGCIEANKENDKRHRGELDSSKFVMDQVQSQLISTKKELTETQEKLKKTKDELQETKDELKKTKKELKDAEKSAAEAASLVQEDPLRTSIRSGDSADVELMQTQVESLKQKLEHRQSRIDNLQHILSMKDREHETELNRQKARASMFHGASSDNEEIRNLQAQLEETMEELEQLRDEYEQQTELMIEAEDKLKEADQALYNRDQMEDRMDQLQEALDRKTQELEEIENELETMHEMMEQSKIIMNDQAIQLEEKEMQLNAMRGSPLQPSKPAVDEGGVASVKEELKQTMDQLKEREMEIKKLKDDLQNTKEIMDIQAQVLQDYKNNPPAPAPAPKPSSDSEDEDEDVLGRISIAEHMETVQDLQKQLENARDKIAEQSSQITEQHKRISDFGDAPWREKAKDEPSLEDMQKELEIATERNRQLESQIQEIEDNLEETMREFEQQAALIQSKDEEIRALERAQSKGDTGRDNTEKSSDSEIANQLKDKERIIESLEMQLMEADEAIQELRKEHLAQRKSMASSSDTAREEREAFIESLEMQLEDADTSIRKFEGRVREKDSEIQRLETELGETRKLLEEAQQAKDENRSRGSTSRGSDSKDSEEKGSEIARMEKKLKDLQAKASLDQDEIEEKETEIARLEKKLKDLQAKVNRSETEAEEKDAEIARLEKKLKELQTKTVLDQDELEDKEEEIARLEKKLKDLQARSSMHGSEDEEKDAEIARLTKKLKDVEKKLKEVQERAMSEEDFAGVQKALLHADKSMKKGQKQITKLTEQLEGTEKAKAELEQELAKVQELIEQKDATIKSLELKVEGAEASLAMSQEEFGAQSKELDKIRQSIQVAQQESRDGPGESEFAITGAREQGEGNTKTSPAWEMDKLKASLLEKEKLAKSQAEKIEKLNASVQTLKEKLKATGNFGEYDLANVSAVGANTEAMTYQQLQERLAVLHQQQVKSAAETEEKEKEIDSLRKDLDRAKEDAQMLASVRAELEDARKNFGVLATGSNDDKVKALHASLEQQQKELDRLRVEKQALEGKLRAIEKQALEEKLRAMESNDKSIQSLEKEIGLHEKDAMIASLERELQGLTSSDKPRTTPSSGDAIAQLQADVTVRDQTISALQGRLMQLEKESMLRSNLEKTLPPGDTRAMGEELIRAQMTISNLQKEIGDLEANMKQALSALIKDKDSEIKRLNGEFDNATKVVVAKEAEIALLKVQLEDKEKALAMTTENREKLAGELEIMKKLNSVLECENDQARKDEEARAREFEVAIETLKQQLEISEESIRTLQRQGQETKRKSLQAKDDTQAEMVKLKERIKTLESEVNLKNQDKIRIKELESQLEREVEQSIQVARKKQSEIDVLTADLQNANSRIEDLGELVRSEREKQSRKMSKDEHRIIDLADRLEQEIDHSESLKKQLDTYKHSLKAKRKIIDSQAHELRDCQDKLDMHDTIVRKNKRKMKQLENEIWNLEGELESINAYLRSGVRPERHRGGYGGGGRSDPRMMKGGPYSDDVSVNQYLDHFSKKVLSARKRLEEAQDRIHGGR